MNDFYDDIGEDTILAVKESRSSLPYKLLNGASLDIILRILWTPASWRCRLVDKWSHSRPSNESCGALAYALLLKIITTVSRLVNQGHNHTKRITVVNVYKSSTEAFDRLEIVL